MPTLIVEDGACTADANTYMSLAEADAYCVARGLWPADAASADIGMNSGSTENTDVSGTDTANSAAASMNSGGTDNAALSQRKARALIRAADWLNALPGGQWRGEPRHPQGVMAWPRTGYAGVPSAVKRAQAELAALLFAGADVLAPQAHGGVVLSASESVARSVGPLSQSATRNVNYGDGAAVGMYYPAVVGLLEPYLRVTPGRVGGGVPLEVGRA